MTLIFMNERIRERRPEGPVIRALRRGKWVEANRFDLKVGKKVIGRVEFNNEVSPVTTHVVRAWVLLTDAVQVIPR